MKAKIAALGLAILALCVFSQAQASPETPRSSAVSTQASPQAAKPSASQQDPASSPDQTKPSPQPAATQSDPPKWFNRIGLSGFLAGDARWRRASAGPYASTTTDLYLRAFELGVEADIDDWISATAVINSEYVGDTLLHGDAADSIVLVDEAHLDINVPRTPFYFVIGKRIQPFGLFESYLVTDLLVQDAYETKAVGITAGVKAPGSTDLSLTAYKGRVRADHLAGSDLLGPETPDFPAIDVANVNSWIVSGLSSPTGDDWRLSAAIASEPGLVRRSTTFNLGSYLSLPFYEHVELAGEFMRALSRDDVPGLGRSFRETALSATLTYLIVTPEMKETAGRNYRARRSRRFAHPVLAALRFEALDDGGRAGALGTWSVKNRMSLGGRYTFYEQGTIDASLTIEYRRQTVRVSPLFAGPVPATHEVYLRFGLDF